MEEVAEAPRYRTIWLVLAFLVMIFGCGLVGVHGWVDAVAARYGASVATTRERVQSNRLIVDLSRHGQKPWNAPIEEAMYVDYDDVPEVMREAILTSEDSWFFYHMGFNPVAIGKALVSQFGDDPRGGSTITQQIAKQVYVGSRRDFKRKFDELAIALWLEWHFSKRELLEFYFNTPFMGHNTKGIEAAARYYFGYSFKRERAQTVAFTPDMAASLAVTIKNPTAGNPAKPRNLREARRLLLAMGIEPTALTAKAVADETLPRRFAAHAFARDRRLSDQFGSARDLAVARLERKLHGHEGSLDVVTFYASETQLYLETAIEKYYPPIRRAGYDRLTAVVVDNATGGIQAIVAPPDAMLYPGSTVKPLLALCALVEKGFTAQSRVDDVALGVPPVRNGDRRYLGRISFEQAMAASRNPPFVEMMRRFGRPCANDLMKRIDTGFRFQGGRDRSLALGAEPVALMDLLDAYVTIATCGRVSNGPLILKQARERGSQSVVLEEKAKSLAKDDRLMAGFDALHEMLRATTGPTGTANGSRFVNDVAAKTGTSDENRQITLITFTRAHTVLVSAAASDPGRLKRHLSSHVLVEMVRNVNANIHGGKDPGPLGCGPGVVVAGR
ncbi:transglycosylase domain-containing protein [Aurantimonas sp. 22II-16-19i]|uniref:transglycosylase domain-containing protein n=1 Tax=Aurantimonas sp. 22II-16-19i TaxID=1317114 RepID=UPI0009F7D559|nr:transglycosylase domain-containing protein [Aurantimonas sp. 22II-16-19i]ORE91458.1 penicillin-binding protein [Aurantimonas sp. 22II-16-19i]